MKIGVLWESQKRGESGLSWHCQKLILLIFHTRESMLSTHFQHVLQTLGPLDGVFGKAGVEQDVRNVPGHKGLVLRTPSRDTSAHSSRSFAPSQQSTGLPPCSFDLYSLTLLLRSP